VDIINRLHSTFKINMKKREESLQIAVSTYLKLQYPGVVFTSESSGIRLTIGQAKKAKRQRSEDKLPDMIILEPRGEWRGLCLELKAENTTIQTKRGTYVAGRIQEQAKTLEKLLKKGYAAFFAVGLRHAQKLIDDYMKLPFVRANACTLFNDSYPFGQVEELGVK
jgi:hypothetical protein